MSTNSPHNTPANDSRSKKKPSDKKCSDNKDCSEKGPSRNFIQQIIDKDLLAGKNEGRVHTRFPPEPNGYLHIGHAKSICLNAGLAKEYGGKFNLRFDDTNPSKEEQEYVNAIKEDIQWLGADWEDRLFFSSDYFEKIYEFALQLIRDGKAYVCDLDVTTMRSYRGSIKEAGKESPYRDRTVAENLELFAKMRAGEFEDGTHTLRAKINMAAANMNLRDPVMYRIQRAHHHRTGDAWCIYPMYDFTHGQSDSLEGITHSVCTMEFEDHRPLYDWFCEQLQIHHPQQIEFARLNLSYTIMSKRKLLQLVEEKHVSGWNDPRMPTLSGLRRRGYTPASIRAFCERIGVARFTSLIDMAWLEDALRADLNEAAPRVMGVLRPLKVVIENFPEGEVQQLDAYNHPQKPEEGIRQIPFSRELYIEQADFMEDAPKKFFRLTQGREVRLRYAYFLKCNEVIKDDAGNILELRCTYDPETKGGKAPDGRKVKGTIHWVSAPQAIEAEVRLYDHLFNQETPDKTAEGGSFLENLNPDSVEVLANAKLEPSLKNATAGQTFQFERNGYFNVDCVDSEPNKLVFNRTVTLRDTWAKKK